MSSSKTWALLWALFISAMIVAGCGLAVSYKALSRAEFYAAQCTLLMTENERLKERLEKPPVTTEHKLVISVADSEFAPKTLARANRNLLNIKTLSNGDKFVGQIGSDKFDHAIFSHPAYSVRAGAMILKNYELRHGINTLRGIVNRFCTGNNKQYTAFLSKRLGIGPDEKFSIREKLPELIPAMIYFETGEEVGAEYTSLIATVLE